MTAMFAILPTTAIAVKAAVIMSYQYSSIAKLSTEESMHCLFWMHCSFCKKTRLFTVYILRVSHAHVQYKQQAAHLHLDTNTGNIAAIYKDVSN